MSQESSNTSLYSDLFFDENFNDYDPIPIETIRQEASKCINFLNDTYNEESDISVNIDESSSESENECEHLDHSESIGNDSWTGKTSKIQCKPFIQRVGPTHNLNSSASPIDFLSLYWDENLLNSIVDETNRYLYKESYYVEHIEILKNILYKKRLKMRFELGTLRVRAGRSSPTPWGTTELIKYYLSYIISDVLKKNNYSLLQR